MYDGYFYFIPYSDIYRNQVTIFSPILQRISKSRVQRGYDWYEETGHRLMDPAAVTSVEKATKIKEECESFWEQGIPKRPKVMRLKLAGRCSLQPTQQNKWVICVHDYRSTGKEICLL